MQYAMISLPRLSPMVGKVWGLYVSHPYISMSVLLDHLLGNRDNYRSFLNFFSAVTLFCNSQHLQSFP